MKARESHLGPKPAHRPHTRAERRLAARMEIKAHPRTSNANAPGKVMLAALIVVVGAIGPLGWAILKGGTASSAPTASPGTRPLVVARDLNTAPQLLRVGTIAPNFAVRDITGDRFTLAENRGHPVLLEFFATWCPHCHDEAPIIHRVANNYGARNVQVLAIVANPYGPDYEISQGRDLSIVNADDLNEYRTTYAANYPLLVDRTFKTVNRYGADSYPTIYVINGLGRVVYDEQGEVPYATLSRMLDRALK